MKWNEFAKIGRRLEKAFRQQQFKEINDCSFVFDILDKVKLDKGYHLISVCLKEFLGGEYRLYAVTDSVWKDLQTGTEFSKTLLNDSLWNHLTVEESEMGVWQAKLLDFALVWMPLFWHAGYNAKKYMFSSNTLRSLSSSDWGETSFNYKNFINDERLLPKVFIDKNNIVISYVYWNDWQGLVLRTDHCHFDNTGHLINDNEEEEDDDIKNEEILFEYNCGILF